MFDATTIWAFWHKRRNLIGQVVISLLIFMVGWQLGKIMSPYYAAQPIVFEDSQCDNPGDRGELSELQAEGVAKREQANSKQNADKDQPDTLTATPKSAVAGTATNKQTNTAQKKFVGSVNSNLYHDPTCSSSKRIKEQNQIWFANEEEARRAGYSPSKCTREKLGM